MADTAHRYARAAEASQRAMVGLSGRPFGGVIKGVNPYTENMDVTSSIGGDVAGRVVHPYVGTQNWHRVGPDSGQQVLMQMRMDTKEPVITGYLGASARDTTPELRLSEYMNGRDLYRPISQGEQELSSSGVAQVYLAHRGILDTRGGYVRAWLDQDNLEAGARAVTHVRELHLNKVDVVGDEERFGGVTRPDSSSKVFRKIVEAPPGVPSLPNVPVNASAASDPVGTVASAAASLTDVEPAKEFMYVLKTSDGPIVDHREGHVVDDSGELAQGKLDGNLRFNKKIYGKLTSGASSGVAAGAVSSGIGSETYEEQVDDSGNMYIGLPSTATKGIKIEIPAGKWDLQSGTGTASLVMDGLQQTFKLVSTSDGTVKSESGLKIHSPQVKVGLTEAATNKVYKTNTKKAAQLTLHGGLGSAGTADGALNTAMSGVAAALAAVNAACMACPLTPGVVVGLLGMAHSALPAAFHVANGVLKIAKGGLSGAYVGAQDTHESQTVSISD